ncbi:MAG: S41 family peptidase [Phycisphaerales bacterium]|nr:S41 family peptidase [Phycisphaerales bacterium]
MLTALIAALSTTLLPAPSPLPQPEVRPRQSPAIDLPDTPHGRAAAAFLRTLNDGSPEACLAFEETYRAESRRDTPAAQRAARLAGVHAELAPVTVRRVRSGPDGRITLVAAGRDGQTIVMEFLPDPASPERIEGVRMEIGGDGIVPIPLNAEDAASAVNAAAEALERGYVFPEVGNAMAERLRQNLRSGAYAPIEDDLELARVLTDDLQAISRDRHLSVRVRPRAEEQGEVRVMPDEREMAANNYGFREVQVLPGNIGLVRFDVFVPGPEAEATAAAAMAFVRNCDAIVFDLRGNGGGSPEMIRFLTSYLFEAPTHLNDMVDRTGAVVEEFWTLEAVPGHRPRPGVPVFVLTSARTFSGAEEFAYNLKILRRATIVGERTGGGAHPVRAERLSDRLVIRVPYLRARNPISGTNWEGAGVEPDLDVPAAEALDRALELASAAAARHDGAPR